jgi:integrase
VNAVLQFLTELFDQGLGFSAINSARSALSAFLLTDDDKPIGTHSAVCRFMKGVYQLRTPLPRYSKTWDVSVLLNYFKKQKDNAELSLKEITLKLVSLLLISSAQRVQTIQLIRLSCIFIDNEGCVIPIIDKLKSTRPGYRQEPLKLSRLPQDTSICVVNCLEHYIEKTRPLRGDSDQLLLCYSRPHGPASKDSVARWCKSVLKQAGILEFGAHSFRSASSSAMLHSGLSIDTIMQKGGWSNAKTFHKFYNRSLV